MKKKILITGGIGYIGSHGVVAFEQAGYETIILDNLSNSSRDTLSGIEKILGYTPMFYECDLCDITSLREIFQSHKFSGVIHFAGLKAPFESQPKALIYLQNNVGGSLNLFECMQEHNVKNIIFSSSASTYASSNIPPISETAIQETSSPYGTTKYLIEKILKDLAKFSGFHVTNLRYFNPIGAHKSGELGEKPDGIPNNLFPYIFKVYGGELEQLQIFGDDYDTPDGTGIRDYVDVGDLVDAHVLAYKKMSKTEASYSDYNVGTGKGVSVFEVIKIVETVVGKKLNYSIVPRREGDIPISFCDTSKITAELGWKASTPISESVANSYKFHKNL